MPNPSPTVVRRGTLGTTAITVALEIMGSWSAAQVQSVQTTVSRIQARASSSVELRIRYETDPPQAALTGIGFRVHFDSSQLSFVELLDVFGENDSLLSIGPVEEDRSNFDLDPSTDQFVPIAWLDANGSWPGLASVDLFSVRFQTREPFIGSVLRFSASSLAAGYAFMSQPAFLFNHQLNFAQFTYGAGLFSQLILVNLDAKNPAGAEVFLNDPNGFPVSTVLNGEVLTGQLEVAIPPSGLLALRTENETGPLIGGSIVVNSDQPLSGVVVFGGVVGLAGVGNSQPLEGFFAPIETDRSGDVNTGVAIMNLEPREQMVTFRLSDADGSLMSKASDTLPMLGRKSVFVDRISWEDPIDFSNFRGVLRAEGDGGLAATVIQTRPGQFATMPVIGIPEEGVDSSAIDELGLAGSRTVPVWQDFLGARLGRALQERGFH